ncbi:MAG: hypothetical protein MJA29_05560, partial [Candidatus Omnitrophica bacterium]|nr:hypothetical protein [Candidatus Omnitrophota bacterium]
LFSLFNNYQSNTEMSRLHDFYCKQDVSHGQFLTLRTVANIYLGVQEQHPFWAVLLLQVSLCCFLRGRAFFLGVFVNGKS